MSPSSAGLGGRGTLNLMEPSPHPAKPENAVGDVSPARRGRKGAVENTPNKAHRRIWQSRSCRESGNVEGISLWTGKWRGAAKRQARGQAGVRAPRAGGGACGEATPVPGWGRRPSQARATSYSHPHPHSGAAQRAGAKPAPLLPPASAPRGGKPAAPPPPPRAETLRL